jgi:hypothetical protein
MTNLSLSDNGVVWITPYATHYYRRRDGKLGFYLGFNCDCFGFTGLGGRPIEFEQLCVRKADSLFKLLSSVIVVFAVKQQRKIVELITDIRFPPNCFYAEPILPKYPPLHGWLTSYIVRSRSFKLAGMSTHWHARSHQGFITNGYSGWEATAVSNRRELVKNTTILNLLANRHISGGNLRLV